MKSPRALKASATSLKQASEPGEPAKLEAGQEHDFKIIKINVEEKKVGLSLRAVPATKPAAPRSSTTRRKHAGSHKQPVSSSTTTLGDLINWRKNESK